MSTATDLPDTAHDTAQGPRTVVRLVVAAVVIIIALGGGGALAALGSKLSEVTKDNASSYLPSSAESTKSLDLETQFAGAQTVPTVVVWERESGLTAQDRTQLAQAVTRVGALPDLAGAPSPLVVSADGKAAQTVVPLSGDDGFDVTGPVEAITTAADVPGLRSWVTGTGGLSAEFSKAFEGIDGKLLVTAGLVVLVILLIVYRSPVFLPVLLSAVLALFAAQGVVYLIAKNDVLTVNSQSSGILLVLVFGAGTDYALLLISRFKEELHHRENSAAAMLVALRASLPAIVASGLTVILGLLCLLLSDLESNKALGPVSAVGIACAMVAMLTFLPALLVLFGRYWFWPFVPRRDALSESERGIWGRVSLLVGRRARAVWVICLLVLGVFAGLSTRLDADGITQADAFTTSNDAVVGQTVFERHFPAGGGAPTSVIGPQADLDRIVRVVKADKGVADAAPFTPTGAADAAPKVIDGQVQVFATLRSGSDTDAAQQTVVRLRESLDAVSPTVLVGGPSAITYDVATESSRDNRVIIPTVLVVIFVILALLLRSLLAPVLLVASVVLSFLATLGVCGLVFRHVFDFAGEDQAFPLFAFIFLVALGIDYNIFLMTRVREESLRAPTRDGILRGLAVTGGVITSAGLVLAATFAALAVLPIVFLAEIGFAVAFGVLLDTLLVRSLLVPAVVHELGERTWWPFPLRRKAQAEGREEGALRP